jgi:hypothetical protein
MVLTVRDPLLIDLQKSLGHPRSCPGMLDKERSKRARNEQQVSRNRRDFSKNSTSGRTFSNDANAIFSASSGITRTRTLIKMKRTTDKLALIIFTGGISTTPPSSLITERISSVLASPATTFSLVRRTRLGSCEGSAAECAGDARDIEFHVTARIPYSK